MITKKISTSFTRPAGRVENPKEQALDEYFENENEKNGSSEHLLSAAAAGLRGGSENSPSQITSDNEEGTQLADLPPKSNNAEAARHSSGNGFDINRLATSQIEPEGFVTRNFRIKRSFMNKIKELTVKANNEGHRKTQDDIINSIFEDWFKNR